MISKLNKKRQILRTPQKRRHISEKSLNSDKRIVLK